MQELADAPRGDSKFAQLRRYLEEEDIDQLEAAWVEILAGDVDQEGIDALLGTVQGVLELGKGERAAGLLELLLPTIQEKASSLNGATLVRFQELLVRAFPDNRDLFRSYVEAFQEEHGPSSAERAYFLACGVPESDQPAQSLARLDRLRAFRPGAVVYHESGWGIGEILAVDPLHGQIRVDLEGKKDHRISLSAADTILEVLPEESFRGMLYRGGEALREMSENNSVGLVQKILDEFGNPLPQKDIKARLVPEIIAAKSWTRWWTQAKQQMRESGFYRVGDRSPYRVERLETELSFEDDLLARFDSPEYKESRLATLQILKAGSDTFPTAYKVLIEALEKSIETEEDTTRLLDTTLLQLRRNDTERARELAKQVFTRLSPEDIATSLVEIPSGEDIATTFDILREVRPDEWKGIARAVFLDKSDSLRAVACAQLEQEDPDTVRALSTEILASPRLSPEAFSWLIDRRLKGDERPVLEPIAERRERGLLVLTFDLLEHLVDKEVREGRAAVKDLFRRVEGLLWSQDGIFFEAGVKIMTSKERVQLHKRLVSSQDHLPAVATKLLEILMSVEPVIGLEEEVPAWEDDSVIYTTAAGLERRREEYREITEVKIPEIIKAIGIAREFGDLSENAEYTSALEERDKLTKRATVIEEDLNKAKIIEETSVANDIIAIGSKIRVHNLDEDVEVSYSVLGPWDGGPDDGVLNYRSPLGKVFLGRGVGEEIACELPGGIKNYRILEARSHFSD